MTHIRARLLFGIFGCALLVAGCDRGGEDIRALGIIQDVLPSVTAGELPGGELYYSFDSDGACDLTLCPRPEIDRMWVIDCDRITPTLETWSESLLSMGFVDQDLEQEFTIDGVDYSNPDGREFKATIDGEEITFYMDAYRGNAEEGSQPTEEPYLSDPSLLTGRCAVMISGDAPPAQ